MFPWRTIPTGAIERESFPLTSEPSEPSDPQGPNNAGAANNLPPLFSVVSRGESSDKWRLFLLPRSPAVKSQLGRTAPRVPAELLSSRSSGDP